MFRGFLRRLSGLRGKQSTVVIDSHRVNTAEESVHDLDKKINGRKRHVIVDTDGLPSVQRVHEASVQDRDGAVLLIREFIENFPTAIKVWADGGYADSKLQAKLFRMGLNQLMQIVRRSFRTEGST